MKEIIRRSIIARKGCCIIETDFKGIEVCVTSCYNLDPVLIKYIKNPKLDMHRDMAAKCFMVKPEEVSGDMRYAAKNMFVFPEFYGSYYIDCARNLWEAIPKLALCTSDGRDMAGVLQTAGISKLGACRAEQPPKRGTFEAHIKEVEDWLWNEQFTGYRDWKKSWYRQYLKQGYVETLTGFVLSDVVKRNDIINHPVQGSAFHCLLWTLITLNKQIKKRKMKTKIIGQIHDSIVADVPEKEVQDYLGLVKHVVEVMLPEHWKWIIVPMGVEAEASPINGSWYEKAKVDM
jgi:DNA polymerase I-like protein with 3'-5' exonuclease and polymerase domains